MSSVSEAESEVRSPSIASCEALAEWTSASGGLPELINEAYESLLEHRTIRLGTVPTQLAS